MFDATMAEPQDALLMRLQDSVGCAYMSDLHLTVNYARILKAVRGIRASSYPASAWNAVLHYITDAADSFDSAEAAREKLLHLLAHSKT